MALKDEKFREIYAAWSVAAGAAFLAVLWFADHRTTLKLNAARADAGRLEEEAAASGAALEELRVLRELKVKDVNDYKEALKNRARSKKTVYEAGAALQEEKRLLEKQLEIMTTYVDINEETGKILLMRGDHALKDYPFSYLPLRVFGPAGRNMPPVARIISKERYAHPERGKVQEKDGKITWEPPQVGSDPRSGGLGEYVLFTDSPLIVHGPPPNKKLHEAFPHVCAGVSVHAARSLFENTFIGTKILYEKKKPAPPAPAEAPAAHAGK
ncbi:MAG: L,D-transpeptidase [Elusimicrobiales bacterium]|jgi:hypothetical protein